MQDAQGHSSFEQFMLAAFTFQAQRIKHDPLSLLWDGAHRNKSRARPIGPNVTTCSPWQRDTAPHRLDYSAEPLR
ncbi:hypothetical protein D8I24_3093 (plasmid) [Cupriavidus necator H850]|uniref:hypothetical protein n=1 Tax=Cupriavidus necator TaxID=106590 RepID=UPI00129E7096|nr:hypothetical protein [Cupriavidus necator]KAI3602915.1 hypothetical protein D8I24_3093 [Cupriavidus necator H850]